jgi:adenosylhomocysteine nucleosidase
MKSGVGKVTASTTTQYIIDNYKPIYIINTGIAGSLSPDLKAGDVIIVDKLVQHDFDVTAFGKPRGYISNGIEPNKPTIFHSDKKLVEKFKKELILNQNKNIKIGTIATGDIFVNQEKHKKAIRDEFNADAIDMESAAIAQAAERNNVPLIVVRTISDSENNSVSEYKQNKKITATKAAMSVLSVLNKN